MNFSQQHKNAGLSLPYNWVNNYLFVNALEIYKFKAKVSEINAAPLCLGNVPKYFLVDNMKKTLLYGHGFSDAYDSTDVAGVLDIHKYLMKKHDIK